MLRDYQWELETQRMSTTETEALRSAPHLDSSEEPQRQFTREDESSLLEILILFARRKRFIASFTGISLVLVSIVSLIIPNSYTATTLVLPPQSTGGASALMAQLSNNPLAALAGKDLGLKNPADMYVAMLKSQRVENAIVERFDLMRSYHAKWVSDARKALESHSTIESNPKDGLIHISVEDKNAKRSAEMANAFVEEFKKLSATLAVTEAAQRRLFFEEQMEQAKANLNASEEQLKLIETKTGLIQLDSQARAVIESVAALRGQIAAKEVQIDTMRSFAADQNAELRLAEQQLLGLKEQLAKMGGGLEGSSTDLLLPKGRVPEAGLEYLRTLRTVKYNEAIFEFLAKQLELAKIDEAKQGSIIQVVDPAIIPDKRSFPKRTIMVLVGGLCAFILSLVLVFAEDAWSRLRERPEERERLQVLKAELLGKAHSGDFSNLAR
ncbi:MAG TPA: Wzz/FepE/Etk N-terminal domain-containing protein [Terriglobales bacterium]|nr:Wzz/FepE/Etk N-terminal domain-containing protein [Terriglobales bacterium]